MTMNLVAQNNTNLFSYSSGGEKSKSHRAKMKESIELSGSSRNPFPYLFYIFETAYIPRLMALFLNLQNQQSHHSDLCFPGHIFSSDFYLHLRIGRTHIRVPLIRTLMITLVLPG